MMVAYVTLPNIVLFNVPVLNASVYCLKLTHAFSKCSSMFFAVISGEVWYAHTQTSCK